MIKIVWVFLLLAVEVFGAVTCRNVANSSNNGTWSGTTCSGGSRPFNYVLTNADYYVTESRATIAAQIQAVVDDSQRGDYVMFTAGQSFNVTPGVNGLRLTKRQGASGYVTLTTTEHAKLPPEGVRISPAYKPVMATLEYGLSSGTDAGWVFIYGPDAPDHFKFRGLYNRFSPEMPANQDATQSMFYIGGIVWGNTTNGYVQTGENVYYQTTLRTAASVGATQLDLAGDLSRWRVGDVIYIAQTTFSGNTIQHYTIQSVNTSTPGSHFVTVTPAVPTGGFALNATVKVSVQYPEYQPDDIVIQQCVFINPHMRFDTVRFVWYNGQRLEFIDNWADGPYSIVAVRDSNIIGGTNAVGPLIVRNNYMSGGTENFIQGGGYAGVGDTFTWADVRHNNWVHYEERDNVWDWCVVLDAGCTGTSSTSVGTTNPLAGMSAIGMADRSPRLVFSGRVLINFAASKRFRAMNTGIVAPTQPNFAAMVTNGHQIYSVDPARTNSAIYGTTWCKGDTDGVQSGSYVARDGDGVCFEKSANFTYDAKNNFELKRGENFLIQHNSFDGFWSKRGPINNNFQCCIVNIKSASNDAGENAGQDECDLGMAFPACDYAKVFNIKFWNNVLKNNSGGGALFQGSQSGEMGVSPNGGNGAYSIVGNISIRDGRPIFERDSGYSEFRVAENANGDPLQGGVEVRNNTFYSPFLGWYTPTSRAVPQFSISTQSVGYLGRKVFSGNILYRWPSFNFTTSFGGVFRLSGTVSGGSGQQEDWGTLAQNYLPNTTGASAGALPNTAGTWGKQIILGTGDTGAGVWNWPSGTVYTGCPTTTACITGGAPTTGMTNTFLGLWDDTFADRASGKFWLKSGHWGKRANDDGTDVGADIQQLAMIQDLRVQASDTQALFTWSVTPPLRDQACSYEIHNAPDMQGNYDYSTGGSPTWHGATAKYQAEQDPAQIGTYYSQDNDQADRNTRSGSSRMVTIGYAVPLTAERRYYYYLHCGGDWVRGYFDTIATVSGNTTISGQGSTMTWGTSYSRATGSITSGGSGTCGSGTCTATVPKGEAVYVQFDSRPVQVFLP